MIDFWVLAAAKSHHSSASCCCAFAVSALSSVCCTRQQDFHSRKLGDLPTLLMKCVIKWKENDCNIISSSHWTKPSSIAQQYNNFNLESSCVCVDGVYCQWASQWKEHPAGLACERCWSGLRFSWSFSLFDRLKMQIIMKFSNTPQEC